MATYPGGIASLHNPTSGESFNDASASDATVVVSAVNNEVVAIETELGTNPKGGSASVAARITATETVANTASTNASSALLATAGLSSTKASMATRVIAGTGLTGGGDLTTDRTLAVSYGTSAGTAVQGNQTLAGDVTGVVGTTVVAKVNGVTVTGTPAAGQHLVATSTTAATYQNIPWSCDPASQGCVAWTMQPGSAQTTQVLTTGTLYLCKVRADYGAASGVRTVVFTQTTNGAGITTGLCMVFDSTGAKVGADSADQSATWNAGSPQNRAVTVGSFAVTQGAFYYIGILSIGGTALGITRGDGGGNVNMGGQTGANRPFSVNGTGLVATVASITPSANAQSNFGLVMGLQ